MTKPNFAFSLLLIISSAVLLQAAGNAPSSIQLSSTPNPSTFGGPVLLSALVSPSTATGSVTFYDGTTVLGTAALKSGQATLNTTLLNSGTRGLKAYYSGDSSFGASASATLSQVVNATPEGAIAIPTNFGTFGAPSELVIGDFNRDGKEDFAVATGSGVAVLLGDGNGTFQQQQELLTGSIAIAVATGDFNGDGNADLAVTNQNDTVSVLLGNGDGTFHSAVNLALPSSGPGSIAVGDFNEDGKADLGIVDPTNSQVLILLGNGDGTFQAVSKYAVGAAPNQVRVGDFNADGKPDLAVTNTSGNSVSVLIGNGDGTFRAAVNYGAGVHPFAIALGDFNGDGKPDLAVANQGASVSILIGNGDGTFRAAYEISVGNEPISIAVADFNADGKADLVVADFENAELDVLLGNGDGTFQTPIALPGGSNPSSLAVGDFNGDGRPDVAVADYGDQDVSVLLGVPPVSPGCTYTVTVSSPQVTAPGGNVTLSIATGSSCPWVITGLPSWINLQGAATGTGPAASIELVIAANASAVRGAQLFVSNASVTVTQLSSVLSVDATGVLNAADYSTAVAPGSLAAVFGNFLLGTPASAAILPIPTSLSGLSLQFGGSTLAPILYASSGQVNVQVPWELAGQVQTTLSASLNSQISFSQTVRVATYAPGIFSLENGAGQGAILNSSNQLADAANPAAIGTYVQIYCTGLGPVTNQPATGAPAPSSEPFATTTTLPIVTIGGATSTVVYSGLAPGTVGEYQINAQVPAGSATGTNVPVVVTMGGIVSNTVTMAVR